MATANRSATNTTAANVPPRRRRNNDYDADMSATRAAHRACARPEKDRPASTIPLAGAVSQTATNPHDYVYDCPHRFSRTTTYDYRNGAPHVVTDISSFIYDGCDWSHATDNEYTNHTFSSQNTRNSGLSTQDHQPSSNLYYYGLRFYSADFGRWPK